MPSFFVGALEPLTVVFGEDARHIAKSLRMRAGETITLCDGAGQVAQGVIESLSSDAVSVRLGAVERSAAEPALQISLYCGWPKGDKADFIVQKAVELGAWEIIFFLNSRSISRPAAQDGERKRARLAKIAAEAAAQSGRGIIPAVRGILPFAQAVEELSRRESYLLYEGSCPALRGVLREKPQAMALMTGCEGGFDREEIEAAQRAGVQPVSLGKRILRCETAPIAALSAILFYFDEMA